MRYHDNTVKGTRRGKKWPEDVRTAALCDLLVHNNLSDVARRYNVPESTLRSWQAQARRAGKSEKSLFEQARANAIQAVAHKAASAAVNSVEYMRRRLEQNAGDAEIYEYCRKRLDELDGLISYEGPEDPACKALGPVREVEPEKPGERDMLERLMARHKPMSDFGVTNYTRTLVSVTKNADGMLEDTAEGDVLQLELLGDEEMMG